MTVKAPFRFARIWRKVHEPAWGRLVSHDIPFKDGVSGKATVRVTARTPLIVGGMRRAATNEKEGEVMPFQLPDGTWALPASTLQGMCRAILEVAAFGRLGPWVDDRYFAYRDLGTSESAKTHYLGRLTSKSGKTVTQYTKVGWLLRMPAGPMVIPCEAARIHVRKVIEWKQGQALEDNEISRDRLTQRRDAKQRLEYFLGGADRPLAKLDGTFSLESPPKEGWPHQGNKLRIYYDRATPAKGGIDGTLVLTGKPQGGIGAGHKKWDFIFHSPARNKARDGLAKALSIDPGIWEAFKLSHFEAPGRKENSNWTFWKKAYERDEPVPVFYWEEDSRITTVGTAFAPKAAFTHSTHDLLRNSAPEHAPDKIEALDLPHLIFGAAADDRTGLGLKRRATFRLARAQEKVAVDRLPHPLIMLGPKPSYFPIYVRQEAGEGEISGKGPHATYSPMRQGESHLVCPELAGVKIWPAAIRDEQTWKKHSPGAPIIDNRKVQTHLNPLPIGTTFKAPLVFHNLRPVELGALLWALSFGKPEAFGDDPDKITLCHRLGMGKAVHLGAVSIQVKLSLDDDCRNAMEFVRAFEDYMSSDDAIGPIWKKTKQVKALLKSATPEENTGPDDVGNLVYMDLVQRNEDRGTYVGERNRGGYLVDYVPDAEDLARPSPQAAAAGQGKTTSAPAPDKPPELPLVIGAHVRLIGSGHEGIIRSIRDEFNPRCKIRIKGLPDKEYRAGAFVVIALPEGSAPS